jgi:uracil-DNA glycosylase
MIHESWLPLFNQYDFDLDSIYEDIVYPPKHQVFRVFEMSLKEIKLVFLGQDPYINEGQAHGLAFSVEKTQQIPPSLRNIYKELQSEFPERGYKFTHGDLSKWINEGIFLLNTSLTVKAGQSNSHSKIWKEFTDDVIKFISDNNPNAIFLLLGNNAKDKSQFIKNKKIITGIHPSPLSAIRGFFGSNIFRKVEEILKEEINWQN